MLGLHLRHLCVHAALIVKMLLRCIKNWFFLGHVFCEDTRKKPQSIFSRLIPIRKILTSSCSLCRFARLVCLTDLFVNLHQWFQKWHPQIKIATDLRINDHISRHHILVVQILCHELLCCLKVCDYLTCFRKLMQYLKKHLCSSRLIAPRCRWFHRACICCIFLAFISLLTNSFAGDGIRAALEKVIDLFLRVALTVSGIRRGQPVDHICPALERSKIADHGIPVMLG